MAHSSQPVVATDMERWDARRQGSVESTYRSVLGFLDRSRIKVVGRTAEVPAAHHKRETGDGAADLLIPNTLSMVGLR